MPCLYLSKFDGCKHLMEEWSGNAGVGGGGECLCVSLPYSMRLQTEKTIQFTLHWVKLFQLSFPLLSSSYHQNAKYTGVDTSFWQNYFFLCVIFQFTFAGSFNAVVESKRSIKMMIAGMKENQTRCSCSAAAASYQSSCIIVRTWVSEERKVQ